MDFALPEVTRMVRDTVRRFVKAELIPHEALIIRREAERGFRDEPLIPPELETELQAKAKAIGLWGVDVPEEFGGQGLGMLTKCAVIQEIKYTILPFVLPPESPNLFLLSKLCRGSQVDRYLVPYARGEKRSCLALSEPGAGSDAGAITTRATRKNGKWVLNGSKTWISNARRADFIVAMAKVEGEGGRPGMTAFLVDKDAPGMTITGPLPMIGEHAPYSIFFDNVVLDDDQMLGDVGEALEPLKLRLGVRRLDMAARCVGLAERCIDMMVTYANQRSTFGAKLADRQAMQFFVADSYQELEMVRLLMHKLAWRIDLGETDIRLDGAAVKIQSTEMVGRVVDRAIQLYGGMGLSKELPLEYIARQVRVLRIVEGPSEVHRWTIGRDLMRHGRPIEA
ncbi:MAG: acyl-CoA dehydrogenase family protein [Pseudomonadota bacterium]